MKFIKNLLVNLFKYIFIFNSVEDLVDNFKHDNFYILKKEDRYRNELRTKNVFCVGFIDAILSNIDNKYYTEDLYEYELRYTDIDNKESVLVLAFGSDGLISYSMFGGLYVGEYIYNLKCKKAYFFSLEDFSSSINKTNEILFNKIDIAVVENKELCFENYYNSINASYKSTYYYIYLKDPKVKKFFNDKVIIYSDSIEKISFAKYNTKNNVVSTFSDFINFF